MPDGDRGVRSAARMMVRDHRSGRFPSADALLICPGRSARRAVSFIGWRRGTLEQVVDPVGQIFSDGVVTAEFFVGGSVVMQAMDQTNPASSRAIAVTTTCFNFPFAIM